MTESLVDKNEFVNKIPLDIAFVIDKKTQRMVDGFHEKPTSRFINQS